MENISFDATFIWIQVNVTQPVLIHVSSASQTLAATPGRGFTLILLCNLRFCDS